MRLMLLFAFCFLCAIISVAQKKPLDHSVYDSWQSIGEKMISNNGKWVVYTIDPQEGDQQLVIQSTSEKYKKIIERGDSATITEDSRFVIFRIKPLFHETRQAKIQKKRGNDLPMDSLCIVEMGKEKILKIPRVKNYKTPARSFGWVAYQLGKGPGSDKTTRDKKYTDSLLQVIDSLNHIIRTSFQRQPTNRDQVSIAGDVGVFNDGVDADDADSAGISKETPADLVLRNLYREEDRVFRNVLEYAFSKNGEYLLLEQAADPAVAGINAFVLYYDLQKGIADTLSRGGNDFRNFALTDDGAQVAFLAERDARRGELQKFYKLWYYNTGMDSAILLADKNTMGMKLGMTISEQGNVEFSKNGTRVFFRTAPIRPARDTTLVDIDLVKLDIWHYKDDYIQTNQLNRLRRQQQENYLAVYHLDLNKLVQLGTPEVPQVLMTGEGNGDRFVGVSDFGKRIESQWEGATKKDIYAIDVYEGNTLLVKKDLEGMISVDYQSPLGKYIMWYDSRQKDYFAWDGSRARNITASVKFPLYNEKHDTPNNPSPYGIMGWHELDSFVYIYDRYDVWSVDPLGNKDPVCISRQIGRKDQITFRYQRTDPEKKFFSGRDRLYFISFNNNTKARGIWNFTIDGLNYATVMPEDRYAVRSFIAARNGRNNGEVIYTKENFNDPPDLYTGFITEDSQFHDLRGVLNITISAENKISAINPQQSKYTWGVAELVKWQTYAGHESEGIVYKPEDFDPRKKYPMICYFYERLSDSLCNYHPPAPTPSRLNIPFFVSRGYIVFVPDIHYSVGHPGRDAYDHVVSGARALVRKGFVDSTRIGLQGQSWGGYQVAYIITATNLFKAAWAGAPVANMTSAYGGIRWESGLNRQFQYEKTQSRIGASLWEKPELYIENSPLFHLPKVKTPLVIMANDADGAVPWYQGIELFTAMRRLGKQVWMLNYNGEAHNLAERKNRKDIQVRQQQYFDWLLKGERPARWITEGIPAIDKGTDWGLK